MSATVRARSATTLAKGSGMDAEAVVAGSEVEGNAAVEAGGASGIMAARRGLDIADTRLVGLGFLPELLRRL